MEAITKTKKIGGSLLVTIPMSIVKKEGLTANQAVKIEIKKAKVSGFGMAKGMRPFSKEDKFKGQLEE